MKRALIAALLLAGCGSGEKPLKMGDPVLIDSGGKDVLISFGAIGGAERPESALVPAGTRATFLDYTKDRGSVRLKVDGGPTCWVPAGWIKPVSAP